MSLAARRVCKKCKKRRNVDKFPLCSGSKEKRKLICHECAYGNRVHFYESASKEEILANLKRRLMAKVEKTKGCWGWNGFIRPDGYTRMKHGTGRTKSIGGHVISWMVHNKQIEVPTLNVLHACDNRSCCNPNHLFLGTYSDNMIDMVLKKRHPGIKLAVAQVKIIKERLNNGVTVTRLAKDFKVNWVTIDDIKRGRTWNHTGGVVQFSKDHGNAVLTTKEVKKIKKLLALGVAATKIAKDFKVSRGAITNINLGRSWENVGEVKSYPICESRNKVVLTAEKVKEIKKLLALGVVGTKIARDFKVANSTIYAIKSGRTWKHV